MSPLFLNAEQRSFIGLFTRVELGSIRAAWLGDLGANLGPVVDHLAPPPGARLVRIRAALIGGIEIRAADRRERRLVVEDLAALEPLWADPLRALNAEGERYALEASEPDFTETFRIAGRPGPVSFKVSPPDWQWLSAQRDREGRSMTAIILDALALYRDRVKR